jgi:cytochrome c peroxidase
MNFSPSWLMAAAAALAVTAFSACKPDPVDPPGPAYPAVEAAFGGRIRLDSLAQYANQPVPAYITKDNSLANPITDAGAALGRVLFYDKQLSVNQTVSCASCHQQTLAFSDRLEASAGVNGQTARHSMRLVNARFANEVRFFWDERAGSLENQTTQPIQDHAEMGFSGQDGDPGLADLLARLGGIGYYKELFAFVYGDSAVTEARIQLALAQFIRSIQSFDSRYDAGRAQAPNDRAQFPNFTQQENQGKTLFLTPPVFGPGGLRTGGGAGCDGCHRAPEFDINPGSRNNGLISSIGGGTDQTVTRSPSLRDLMGAPGNSNGPFMHTGELLTLQEVIRHYDSGIQDNPNLDPRLRPGGAVQRLNLTQAEQDALAAFLRTLGGTAVYTDARWSDPF